MTRNYNTGEGPAVGDDSGGMRGMSSTFGDERDKHTLEEIDRHLKEIPAIKNYNRVRDERDELSKTQRITNENLKIALGKNAKLEDENAKLAETLKRLPVAEQEIAKLSMQIKELKRFQIIFTGEVPASPSRAVGADTLQGRSVESKVIDTSAEMRANKTKDTQNPVVSSSSPQSINLADALKTFLASEEDEIKRRTNMLFNSRIEEWEKSEKPSIVDEAAIQTLQQIIGKLSTAQFTNSILGPMRRFLPSSTTTPPTELARRVNSLIEEEVNTRIMSGYIDAKAQGLRQLVMDNVFEALMGPWEVPCPICRRFHQDVWLNASEVASLVHDNGIVMECVENRDILRPVTEIFDWLASIVGTRRFSLTLAELIRIKLSLL